MDVLTEDVCKILHYTITECRITDNGEVIDTWYYIKNETGEVFSQNYNDIEDPFDILLSMERLILNAISREYSLNQQPATAPDFS